LTFFVILHCAICFFLVVVILLQPGKSDMGIGFGSSSQSIFGSKGAGNFLTKTTSVCALLFLVTSFVLTRSRIVEYTGSVVKDEAGEASKPPAKTEPAKDEKKEVPAKSGDAKANKPN